MALMIGCILHGLDALQGTRAKPGNHLVTYKLLQTVSIPVQPQTNPTHLCAMQQLMIRGVLLYAS